MPWCAKGLNSREKVVRGKQASKTEPVTLDESIVFLYRMFVLSRLTALIQQHLRCINDLTDTWVARSRTFFQPQKVQRNRTCRSLRERAWNTNYPDQKTSLWIPGSLVSWFPRVLDSWRPGFLDFWSPGFLHSLIPGFLDSWSPGFLESWIPGFLDSWIPGFLESWIPGDMDSWISGVLDSSIPGLLNSWSPEFLESKIPGFLDSWIP